MISNRCNMWHWYHRLVIALIPQLYRQASAGRYSVVLALCSPDLHTRSPGDSSLGGERHTRDGYRRWWQRVFRLTAALDLTLRSVTVDGPPWNTTIHTEWTDRVTANDGTIFTNHGTHDGHMRWGRITSLTYGWVDSSRPPRPRSATEDHLHHPHRPSPRPRRYRRGSRIRRSRSPPRVAGRARACARRPRWPRDPLPRAPTSALSIPHVPGRAEPLITRFTQYTRQVDRVVLASSVSAARRDPFMP
jgi:ketosteroid isomerase-like protein